MAIFTNVGITGKIIRILPWAILKQKPQSYVPRLSGDYIPPATNSLSVSQRTLHQSPYTINHQREELCSDTLAQSLLLYTKSIHFCRKFTSHFFHKSPNSKQIPETRVSANSVNFCKFTENEKRSSIDENEK